MSTTITLRPTAFNILDIPGPLLSEINDSVNNALPAEQGEIFALLKHIGKEEMMRTGEYKSFSDASECIGCQASNIFGFKSAQGNVWANLMGIYTNHKDTSATLVHICVEMAEFYKSEILTNASSFAYMNHNEEPPQWNALQIWYHLRRHISCRESLIGETLRQLTRISSHIYDESLFNRGSIDPQALTSYKEVLSLTKTYMSMPVDTARATIAPLPYRKPASAISKSRRGTRNTLKSLIPESDLSEKARHVSPLSDIRERRQRSLEASPLSSSSGDDEISS